MVSLFISNTAKRLFDPIMGGKVEAEFIPREVRKELKIVRSMTSLHKELPNYLKKVDNSRVSEVVPGTRIEEPLSERLRRVKNKSRNEVLSLLSVFKKRSDFDKELSSYLRKGPSGDLSKVRPIKNEMMPQGHSEFMDTFMKPKARSEIVSLPCRKESVPIPRKGWFAAGKYPDVAKVVREEKEKYLKSRERAETPSIQPSKLMEVVLKVDKAIKPQRNSESAKITGEMKGLYEKPIRKNCIDKNFIVGAKEPKRSAMNFFSLAKPSASKEKADREKGLLNKKDNDKQDGNTGMVKQWVLGELKEVYK